MLDPTGRRSAGRTTLVVGALVLLLIGGGFTYAAFDWQQQGCRCDESLYPDWSWVVLAALALASFAAAVAAAVRALKRSTEG